jgi:hypothetical protein
MPHLKAKECAMFQTIRDTWICRFLGRLALLLIVGAALFFSLGVAICKFDSLDVVRRATLYFAPYSSSMPFILILLAIALVCCIPGGPTALLRLSKLIEAEKEINALPATSGKNKAQAVVKLVAEKLNRLKQMKQFILQQHAGRIFATISKTSIHTSLCPQYFDACLTQNDKQVFVRILPVETPRLMAQIEDIEVFCDLVPASLQREVLVNIVIYAEAVDGKDAPSMRHLPAITEVEDRIRNRTNIRLFRYSVTENNAVKPEEREL